MHYTALDPAAQYKIRVVYAGDSPRQKIRLVANGGIEIHPLHCEADAVRAGGIRHAARKRRRKGELDSGMDTRARAGRQRPRLSGCGSLADQKMTQAERWENPVKKKLQAGQPVVAATITVNSIDVGGARRAHGLRFSVDRDGALAHHARDAAQHGAGDARPARGAVRARPSE